MPIEELLPSLIHEILHSRPYESPQISSKLSQLQIHPSFRGRTLFRDIIVDSSQLKLLKEYNFVSRADYEGPGRDAVDTNTIYQYKGQTVRVLTKGHLARFRRYWYWGRVTKISQRKRQRWRLERKHERLVHLIEKYYCTYGSADQCVSRLQFINRSRPKIYQQFC
jgi:hypothetical protein